MTRRKIVLLMTMAILAWSCNSNKTIEEPEPDPTTTSVSFYFSKPAYLNSLVVTAQVMVSAPDMDTITVNLAVTDSSVSGTIPEVPAGQNRKFEISVYDSLQTLTYYGSAFADVPAGGVITLLITLYPVDSTGTVIIVGVFSDFPPFDEKIVFLADYSGLDDIYIMNPDGNQIINLTNTPTIAERHPRISPDRQKIVFSHYNSDGIIRPFIMNIDGTNVQELDIHPGHSVGHLAWSPDGRKLVLNSYYDGDSDIYIYDLQTQQLSQVTNNPYDDWLAVWSPNGDWIAYSTNETGIHKTYLIRPDGSDNHLLANLEYAEERAQEFSPDGTKIVFVARYSSAWDLFLINVDGTGLTQLTDTPDANEYHHGWSPNGQQIIFVKTLSYNSGLYIYNLGSNTIEPLLDDPAFNEDHPHWR